MPDKTTLRELLALQGRNKNLLSSLEEASKEREVIEAEYASTKAKREKQARRLAKIRNSLQFKVDKLSSSIEDLEIKLAPAKEELNELEASHNEEQLQLSKLTAELPRLIKAKQKVINRLKEQLKRAKEELREEKALDLELERSHQDSLNKAKANYEKLVKNARKSYAEREKKATERYNVRAQPLLFRAQCLDSDIHQAEYEITTKSEGLENLKKRHEKLLKKLSKVTATR